MLDLSSGGAAPIYGYDRISSQSPTDTAAGNYITSEYQHQQEQRPSWLFSNPAQIQYHSQSSPTEALSSLLDPFASQNVDPSLNVSQFTGVPYRQMNGTAINRYSSSPMARRQFEPPTSLAPFGSPLTPTTTPLNASSMSLPISSPTNGSSNVPAPKNPKLYKTELCRSWMDHGRCNYGERCQYAHGETEKRPIPRHPKYKTEACQSFHQSGYCPYGPRCHFIHNETELLAQMPASSPLGSTISTPLSNSLSTKPVAAPNNVALVQRMCSLPGYASTGDSAGSSSSADSGSESPNGSFSPGLELDENGPFTAGFMAVPFQQRAPQRFASYEAPKTGAKRELPLNGLLNDIISWTLEDAPVAAVSNGQSSPSPPTTNAIAARWEDSTARLPVFAQLSNPQ